MACHIRDLLSQIYHLSAYSVKTSISLPKRLPQSMFIISIDIDVGSRELALINQGKYDRNVHKNLSEYCVGKIDETALPLFVELFNRFDLPTTMALRGQITEVNSPVLEILLKSGVKHDIGVHGYYHQSFINLSPNEAEKELNLISEGMKKIGIAPKSFVFPRNQVCHLDLLERHSYKCYRGYGNFLSDSMHIEKVGKLWNIHPSFYLVDNTSPFLLRKIFDISVSKKLPFHIWFHLWNFGDNQEAIQNKIRKLFLPFLSYVKRKQRNGEVSCETMLSAALKFEQISEDQ